MSKNIKLFFAVFFCAFPFWWGINFFQKNIENFIYSKQITKYPPRLFIAQIANNSNILKNTAEKATNKTKDIVISAKSALSVEISKNGKKQIFFERQANKKMAIASLTKLMAAVIVEEFYSPFSEIKISKAAVSQEGNEGKLRIGEVFKTKNLLPIMLIESSNDAAFAFSQKIGTDAFVSLMNLKAKEIALSGTRFFNPNGLDPKNPAREANYSTAEDLIKLSEYILNKHPNIFAILGKKQYRAASENSRLVHISKNTNKLLWEIPEIISGKTGFTDKAGGCLISIFKGKEEKSVLVNVVLDSSNRFEDTKKLWLKYK